MGDTGMKDISAVRPSSKKIKSTRFIKKSSIKSTIKVSLKHYDLQALEMKFANLSDTEKNSPEILQILTPPHSSSLLSHTDSVDGDTKTNNKNGNASTKMRDYNQESPKSTPSKQTKKSSSFKTNPLLRQIKSDFSPKFLEIRSPDSGGPTSRFGRELKLIEQRDLFGKRKSEQYNPHLKMTPPPSSPSKTQIFVSPIDKLINKNKLLAAINTQNFAIYEHRKHVSKVIDFESSITESDLNDSNTSSMSSSNNVQKSISLPISLNVSDDEKVESSDNNLSMQSINSLHNKVVIPNDLINNNNNINDMSTKHKNGIKKISKIPYTKDIKITSNKKCIVLIKEHNAGNCTNINNDLIIEKNTDKSNCKNLIDNANKTANNSELTSHDNSTTKLKEQQKNQSMPAHIINEKEFGENSLDKQSKIISSASPKNTINGSCENFDIESQLASSIVMKFSKNQIVTKPSEQSLKLVNNTKNLSIEENNISPLKRKIKSNEKSSNTSVPVLLLSNHVQTKVKNNISIVDNNDLTSIDCDLPCTEIFDETTSNGMTNDLLSVITTIDKLQTNLPEPNLNDDSKINENEMENVSNGITRNKIISTESPIEIDSAKDITSKETLSNGITPDSIFSDKVTTIKEIDSSAGISEEIVSVEILPTEKSESITTIPGVENEKEHAPIVAVSSGRRKRKRNLSISSITSEMSNYAKISEYCRVGELVWARIGHFPFWPAIIFADENEKFDMKDKEKVHVRFFSDRGRRSWVPYKSVIPFDGLIEFERYKNELLTNRNVGLKVAQKIFQPNRSSKAMWYEAIKEADFMKNHIIEDRKRLFEEMVESQINIIKVRIPKKKKTSVQNNDVTFHQLFNSNNEQSTSTPTSSNTKIEMSKSPTPESPAFELLTPSTSPTTSTQITPNASTLVLPNQSTVVLPNQSAEISKSASSEEFQILFDQIKKITFETNTISESNEEFVKILVHGLEMARNKKNQKKDLTTLKAEFCGKFFAEKRIINRNKLLAEQRKIEMEKQQNSMKQQKDAERLRKAAERAKRLVEKQKKDEEEFKTYIIQSHPINILLKGLHRENVCKICTYPGNVIKCNGHCNEYLHRQCPDVNDDISSGRNSKATTISRLSSDTKESSPSVASDISHHITGDISLPIINTTNDSNIICDQCAQNSFPLCFVCNKHDSFDNLLKCTEKSCYRLYHFNCLTYWPQSKIASEKTLLCPCHICHTCISDDPRRKHYKIEQSKLLRCIQCPATYHTDSCCIPAGTEILTATLCICPRHREPKKLPTNANWCFLCAKGGKLICCESCPGTFHADCLKIPMPDKYICEECETGRMPLYGEIVWCKIASFRWWPSIIVPPFLVPDSVELSTHYQHDFCIRFFGSNNYSWASRGQVFLYQEGDSSSSSGTSSSSSTSSSDELINNRQTSDATYNLSLQKAAELFQYAKEIKANYVNANIDKTLKPLPYAKLKTNRPVPPVKLNEEDEDLSICECKKTDEDPCGPQSNCLNRIVFAECTPKLCPVGDACQNQHIQKGVYPNVVERQIDGKGWGLVTLDNIKRESFVIEYVGELINHAEFEKRLAQKQAAKDENFYFFTMSPNLVIDAGPKGNLARFISHSCQPNLETQMWHVNGNDRVGLFALEDIPANTELTFDYNWQDFGGKTICLCGSAKCSGFIGQKYVEPSSTITKKSSKVPTKKRGRKKINKSKPAAETVDTPKMSSAQEMKPENLSMNLSTSFDGQPIKKRLKLG